MKPLWAQAREQRIARPHALPAGKIGFAYAVTMRGDEWREHLTLYSTTTCEFQYEARTPDENDRVVNRLCIPERNPHDWFSWRSK